MRGRNLVQFLRAVDLLSRPEGTSINHLAQALEIDRRSVYRLLDIIQELGFPLFDDDSGSGREKAWKFDRDYIIRLPNIALPEIRLDFTEILALYFLKAESRIFEGTEINEKIDSAYSKLAQFVPSKFQSHIASFKSLFLSPKKLTKDYSGKQGIIDILTKCMLEYRTCLVRYFSFADECSKKFRIDPLHFFEANGGLYVFVRATRFNEIRMLAVERIEDIEEQDSIFEYPENFDPETVLESSFDLIYDQPIDLEVVFSASQAKYIKERIFCEQQEIIDNPDGSIILRMKTSGWDDIKKWLLGYGSEVRVIKPKELRDDMLDEIHKLLSVYGNISA